MTREEKMIVTAYTGVSALDWEEAGVDLAIFLIERYGAEFPCSNETIKELVKEDYYAINSTKG
jgi:hypothetical protein